MKMVKLFFWIITTCQCILLLSGNLYSQAYDLPNQNDWNVGDSWIVDVDIYTNGWILPHASIKQPDYIAKVSTTHVLKITVLREDFLGKQKCWVIDYKTNHNPEADASYNYVGENLVYVSKDNGGLIGYNEYGNKEPETAIENDGISCCGDGIIYSLPIQMIPWKYSPKANEGIVTDKDRKTKVGYKTTHDTTNFELHIFHTNLGERKIMQHWNKKENWWSRYEHEQWDSRREKYHRLLCARLLKYIPSDGFCEWHDKDGKKIADARFVKIDKKNVVLKPKNQNVAAESEITIHLDNLCKADQKQIEMIELANMQEQVTFRIWTDNLERSCFKAKYISCENDVVTLTTDSGRLFTQKLSEISKPDQEYVKRRIADSPEIKSPVPTQILEANRASFESNYPYRRWSSANGQYYIDAKFVSIADADKIEKLDRTSLKNAIVTIEKQNTQKKIKVKFNDLSKPDQDYLIELLKAIRTTKS